MIVYDEKHIITEGDFKQAKKLVKRFHYSKRICPPSYIISTYVIYRCESILDVIPVGACVFNYPHGGFKNKAVELHRLVRVDNYDDFILSKFVSLCIKDLKRRKVCDLLISYADSTYDHHGGIYQALSWNYDGKRRSSISVFSIDGKDISRRALYDIFGTSSIKKLNEDLGYDFLRISDKGKYLYWKALNKNGEEMAKRIGLKKNKYEKPKQSIGEIIE